MQYYTLGPRVALLSSNSDGVKPGRLDERVFFEYQSLVRKRVYACGTHVEPEGRRVYLANYFSVEPEHGIK